MIVANIMTFGRIYDTRSFEFSIKTDNLSAGSSTATQLKLPVRSTGFTPFNVDWGDGTSNFITDSNDINLLHQYPVAGTYNVKCSTVTSVRFNGTNDRLKLLVISKTDGLLITSRSTFHGCANMTWSASASIKTPFDNQSQFRGCNNFNGDISNWDVSESQAFFAFFLDASNFNQNISGWNVSTSNNFASMFQNALKFNQNIGGWNTSNVIFMANMFNNSRDFNQNIGGWNVSAATNFTNFMANKTFLNYSTANYDSLLNGWTNRTFALPELTLDFGTIRRSLSGTEARELMIRPNVTVNITNAINNGSGLIRVTATAHGMSTGNKVFIFGIVGTTGANGGWNVTVIDANTIDLQGSTFVNTYVSGGTVRTGWGHIVNDGGI